MKITKRWLKRQGACQQDIDWFCRQKETDMVELVKLAIQGRDEQLLRWANWVIVRKMKRRQYFSSMDLGEMLIKFLKHGIKLLKGGKR